MRGSKIRERVREVEGRGREVEREGDRVREVEGREGEVVRVRVRVRERL